MDCSADNGTDKGGDALTFLAFENSQEVGYFGRFIESGVTSSRFSNASEVMCEGPRVRVHDGLGDGRHKPLFIAPHRSVAPEQGADSQCASGF